MESKRIKKSVIYTIYSLGIIALIGTIYLIEKSIAVDKFKEADYSYGYVSKTIFDESIPVMADEKEIVVVRPYTNEAVKMVKNYYDYKGEEATQEGSIFFHDDTYMQSTGISYGGIDDFEVVAVMDGTVTSIKEDDLLGNIVEINHDNNITSIYQSLKDISVKKGDQVSQGQLIAKAGTSNLDTTLGNHVYFELIKDGEIVNPEDYYEKTN